MKSWHRYAIALTVGLAAGGALAWQATGRSFGKGDVVNGVWSTAMNYGTATTDELTRAAVARRGLLALPKTETLYWAASTDSSGDLLDGSCTYVMTGQALDTRWWSVTFYDKQGYLVANPANIWSFSAASLTEVEKAKGWTVVISPDRPKSGHWLPSARGQNFELTLRMYNPGDDFRRDVTRATMPKLTKESCA